MYHIPVLLNECIEGLAIKAGGIYVDATFGGGGHAMAILDKLSTGKLIAFDQDEDARQNIPGDERLQFVGSNFRFMKNFLKLYKAFPVDGILADLGISSHQIDTPERGFSTRYDTELDMRMDIKQSLDGKQIINKFSENELKIIFQSYGDISNAALLASSIVKQRKLNYIATTNEFISSIGNCYSKRNENKYLAKVFQAIRIAVNSEVEALKQFMHQVGQCLKPSGRIVIISYHSIEDRIVKNYLKSGNFEGIIQKDFYGNPEVEFRLINRKPIVPGEEEVRRNNRARSAKLRIAEKI